MQPSFNIYELQSARQILVEYLSFRQNLDSSFSLRKWAREMQLNTHTLLQMWMRGQRPIRPKHVPILAKGMSLNSAQNTYLENIVLIDNAKSDVEKSQLLEKLSVTTQLANKEIKMIDEFRVLSDWYYMAILAMGRFSRIDLIERLGHRLNTSVIDAALLRLVKMDLIEERDEIFRTKIDALVTQNDVADSGAKVYFKQTAEMAKQSVDTVDVDLREFQSFAIAINPKKMNQAKKLIRKFRDEFSDKLQVKSKNVYQMNIHFFPLTDTEKSGDLR